MKFRFEVQAYTDKIIVEADSKEEARMKLIESDDLYYEELLENAWISVGEEIREEEDGTV